MALEAGRAAPQAPRALPPLPAAPSPASPPAAEGALFTRCHHGYTSSSLLPASLCGLPVAGCPRELAARWGWLRHRVPHPAPRVAGSCGLPQLPSTLLADLPPPGPAGPEHGLEGEVGDPGCARTRVRREPQSPRAWGPAGAQARSKLGRGSLTGGARVLGLQTDGNQDGCGSPQPPWEQAAGRGPASTPCHAAHRPGQESWVPASTPGGRGGER